MLKRKIVILAILAALPVMVSAQSSGPAYPRVVYPHDSGYLGPAPIDDSFQAKAAAAPRTSQPAQAVHLEHWDKGDGGFQPSIVQPVSDAPRASKPSQAGAQPRHWDEPNP